MPHAGKTPKTREVTLTVKILNTENFADLRQRGGYYVDKTGFLEPFLENYGSATLFVRPRRFGKTLFLSMLAEFFDITRDSRELFAGLKVAANEKLCVAWMNQYPVLSLSLKRVHGTDLASALGRLASLLEDVCLKHRYLSKSALLEEEELEALWRLRKKQADQATLEEALLMLTSAMSHHYGGKPVILLIDEYDAPFLRAGEQAGPVPAFLRTFLARGLQANPFLKFAILAGCTRIPGEQDAFGPDCCFDSTGSKDADPFGFTSSEMDQLLADAGLTDKGDGLKAWYGGYCFGQEADICCPWSILCSLDDLQANPSSEPGPCWVETGKSALPEDCADRLPAGEDVRGKLAALLGGHPIAVRLNDTLDCADPRRDASVFWTFLFQSGFLTLCRDLSRYPGTPAPDESLLAIPNKEVQRVFRKEVTGWLEKLLPARERDALYEALWTQHVQEFEKQLTALLVGSSFHDDRESYYHGMMYGIFAMKYAKTISNGEGGRGLYDLVVPDTEHERAAVLEFKRAACEGEMDKLVREALDQIARRKYDVRLRARGYRTILHVGVAFCHKTARAAFREARA